MGVYLTLLYTSTHGMALAPPPQFFEPVLTLFRRGGGGWGALEALPNFKVKSDFKGVKAMTTKFSDFS